MEYGFVIFPTEYSIQPAPLAEAAEKHGFESLWFPEHTHIPASRETPWPGGGDLPGYYYDTYDPFVALSIAAAVTTRLKLATGVCLVIERDPITLAKEVASLDRLSNGRFLFGVGGGWNAEEMANHGTAFKGRWRVLRERVEAMKAIWSEDQAEYHGKHVDFDPIFSRPKPVQTPHPPIHVGGAAPWAIRRALRYGNGWVPIAGRDDIVEQLPMLKAEADKIGRDPSEIEVSVYAAPPDRDTLLRYREAGIHRAIFGLPSKGLEPSLGYIEKLAELKNSVG